MTSADTAGPADPPDREAEAIHAARQAQQEFAVREGHRQWVLDQRRRRHETSDFDPWVAVVPAEPPPRSAAAKAVAPRPGPALPPAPPSGDSDPEGPGGGNGGGGGGPVVPPGPAPAGGGAGAVPRTDPTGPGPAAPRPETPPSDPGHRYGGGTNGHHPRPDQGGIEVHPPEPRRPDPFSGRFGPGGSGVRISWVSPYDRDGLAANIRLGGRLASANVRVANGQATNGQATNGHAVNGHATNGHATNGHTNGHATNGHAIEIPPAFADEELEHPYADTAVPWPEEVTRPDYGTAVNEDAVWIKERFDELYRKIASPLPPTSTLSANGWPPAKPGDQDGPV